MIGGSARTTGICETPYSWRIWIASAIVSLGWVWTRAGMSPFLARSTSPMVCPPPEPVRKPKWASQSSLKTLVR